MLLTDDIGTRTVDEVVAELHWWESLLREAGVQRQHTPAGRQQKRDARGGEHEVEELALLTAQVSTESFDRIESTVVSARAVIRALARRVADLELMLGQGDPELMLGEAEGGEVRRCEEGPVASVRQLASAPRLRRPA